MREILITGRGGQGAQTAGNLLARAFFSERKHVQTFATYGGARRGTPVSAFIRVDDKPIRLRCDIECASAVLCFDDSLLDDSLLSRADRDALIVVNSRMATEAFGGFDDFRVIAVDGLGIAKENALGKVVNSALLGAFAAAMGRPDMDIMCRVVEETAPRKQKENANACRAGYRSVRNFLQPGRSQ